MHCRFSWLLALGVSLSASAAERKFDFSAAAQNQTPPGFRSTVTGQGKPGDWRVILDDPSSELSALSPESRGVTRRAVLAQVAEDPTDEHFPLLIFDEESFGDFTLSTRFKTVRGKVEQMAGIAFRIQNETNYYVVRASSLGNTFRFYEVVDGVRGAIVPRELPIASGVWHELKVECEGPQIRCSLDGKELISVSDKQNRFKSGKCGFWTKSDSVAYFVDTRITYTPREMPAQTLVRDALKKFPRLLDLQIFVPIVETNATKLVACKDETEIGRHGGNAENAVIRQEGPYFGRDKGKVSVVMPLRDRNGESLAAARVVMKSLPGQTEQSAIARATPVIQALQARVRSLQDLVD